MRVDEYADPGGAVTEKGIVEHPGSVVLVPKVEDNILMLRQYRPALEREILELPAGTRGRQEPWLACAQRELREETGYRAGNFTSLGEIWPAPGLSSELMAIYLASDLLLDPLPQDFDEEIVLSPMPLDDLVTMALDGELQDAKSVIALLRLEAFLRR